MVSLREPLTFAECQTIRRWRNDPSVFPMLRTGYKNWWQQTWFYVTVICQPHSEHRYFGVLKDNVFVGVIGLTYIHDGLAEISLVLGPMYRRSGIGSEALAALVAWAPRFGIHQLTGECYAQSPARIFWEKMLHRRPERVTFTYEADGTLHWTWYLGPQLVQAS